MDVSVVVAAIQEAAIPIAYIGSAVLTVLVWRWAIRQLFKVP